MRAGVAPAVQTELVGLMTSDPEAGKQRRIVEIAAEKSLTLTRQEVRGFLLQMDKEDFDDIELDAVALAAVAGGWSSQQGC